MNHVHFDLNDVLALHEKAVAEMERMVADKPNLQVKLRAVKINAKAFLEFMITEINSGTPPAQIAAAYGAAMAQNVVSLRKNLGETAEIVACSSFMQSLEDIDEGTALATQQFRSHAIEGGRA